MVTNDENNDSNNTNTNNNSNGADNLKVSYQGACPRTSLFLYTQLGYIND